MAFDDPKDTSDAASISENESSHGGYTDRESDSENNTVYEAYPSLKNARNLALMAEERWIIEMLKSIRQQRNALKVEALYYQGLKANLYAKHAKQFGECSMEHLLPRPSDNTEEEPIPEPMFPDLSPGIDECFAPKGPLSSKHKDALMKMKKQMEEKNTEDPSNLEDFTLLEGQCNSLELQNLTVNREKRPETWDIGDPEYESEEEEWSHVNLDMSMLVGGSDQEDDD